MAKVALVHVSQYCIKVDYSVRDIFELKEMIIGSCQSVRISLHCLVRFMAYGCMSHVNMHI